MTYQVLIESGFPNDILEDIDLINIVSNLSNNAIEAACKCEEGFVNVSLFTEKEGTIVIYKFENNYRDAPVENQEKFITLKRDKSAHGIGLKCVRDIVEKYGGLTKIDYDGKIFRITIMFFAAQ